MITGPVGLPPKGGLSSGSEQDVSVERLNGNGAQPILLPSSWQKVLCCQATGGDGGSGGRSLLGQTDDHKPGPAVDCELEDMRLITLSDIDVLTICDVISCSLC